MLHASSGEAGSLQHPGNLDWKLQLSSSLANGMAAFRTSQTLSAFSEQVHPNMPKVEDPTLEPIQHHNPNPYSFVAHLYGTSLHSSTYQVSVRVHQHTGTHK